MEKLIWMIENIKNALNDTIDYGNNMEYEINMVSQTDSEANNSSYTSDSSQDMDVDIKNHMKSGDNCVEEEQTSIFYSLEQRYIYIV